MVITILIVEVKSANNDADNDDSNDNDNDNASLRIYSIYCFTLECYIHCHRCIVYAAADIAIHKQYVV